MARRDSSVTYFARHVQTASKFSSATLHEAAGKIGALPSALQPLRLGMRVAGSAFLVMGKRGDNLALHHAIYQARSGDVLVASTSGGFEYGCWGYVMTEAAIARGLAGLVIDGCVRDSDSIADLGWPIFSRGSCIRGTTKLGRLRLSRKLRIGDRYVEHGDLIVGDADGVVSVRRSKVKEVLNIAAQRDRAEARIVAKLRQGATTINLLGLQK